MLQELVLRNFRGFAKYRIRFSDRSVLVGPNNAGKSSAIAAVRAVAGMRRRAAVQKPERYLRDQGFPRRGWSVPAGYGLAEENLRYDFLGHEVRISASFRGGGRIEAVWPSLDSDPDSEEEDSPAPFFYVLDKSRDSILLPSRVRAAVPEIGVIPILTPIDLHETVRTRDTIVRHVSGRLASRHFRNQLLLLSQEASHEGRDSRFHDFQAFIAPWLPETTLDPPVVRVTETASEIDVFFYERRRAREIAWAGDGFQVFLQALYHLFRLRDAGSVVLDEPDVYLHPDLQRRLFQVVDAQPGQVIFASHSPELVAEAPASAVLWIDRERARAITAPDEVTLQELSTQMGTGFNLRLARVLRARVVLFVEGDDAAVLRQIAKTLGLKELVTGGRIATVSLGGASNRSRLESFGWVAKELLRGTVTGYVILDRDFRSPEVNDQIRRQLQGYGLVPHVWARKELESYLIHEEAIARLVGADTSWVTSVLNSAADELRFYVQSRVVASWYEDRIVRSEHIATVSERAVRYVDQQWSQPEIAWALCPAKDLISAINRAAQEASLATISSGGLARELHVDEVAPEMATLLEEINAAAAAPPR